MGWYTIALGREEQPKDWEDFNETLLRHFSARNFDKRGTISPGSDRRGRSKTTSWSSTRP